MPMNPKNAPMCRAATTFRIAIDGTIGYDYQGIVEHALSENAWSFHGVLELLEIVRDTLDRGTPLQGTHRDRAWKKKDATPERVFSVSEQRPEKGKEATFLLHIQYHQNTTWQGSIEWLEQKRRMPFRSTLELIHLIEQVVGAVKPSDEEPQE